MVGPHHMLFEGNQSHNYDSDDTHGSSFAMTIFRNHLVGRRRDYPNGDNIRAAGLMHGSWWHAFLGNVLGGAGARREHLAARLHPEELGTGAGSEGARDVPAGRQFRLRDQRGHIGTVRAQPLPDSLYLTAKPAFFGDLPWPWVDSAGAVKLGTLPARARYEHGAS